MKRSPQHCVRRKKTKNKNKVLLSSQAGKHLTRIEFLTSSCQSKETGKKTDSTVTIQDFFILAPLFFLITALFQ